MNDKPQDSPNSEPQSNFMRLGIPVVVILAAFWLYNPFHRQAANHEPGLGESVEFVLKPLLGANQNIDNKGLQGKVVLINFWGTWCPPCRAEFPYMAKIEKKFRDQSAFRFISVSCDEVEIAQLRSSTRQFMVRQKAEFAVFHDLSTFTRKKISAAAKQDRFVYPTTVLLDGDGTIRGFWRGFSIKEMAVIEGRIAKLLQSS